MRTNRSQQQASVSGNEKVNSPVMKQNKRRAWGLFALAVVLLGAVPGCAGPGSVQNSNSPQPITVGSQNTAPNSQSSNSAITNSSPSSSSGIDTLNQKPRPMKVVRHGNQVQIDMYTEETTVQIAPGSTFHAWTFDGTVPGPVISLTQGDHVTLTLHNLDPNMSHSIDLHAALVAPNTSFVDVAPGTAKTLTFDASLPGVFMYHCATAPMMLHIAQGMYGAVVVTPKGQQPPKYVIVQSEFYKELDMSSVLQNQPNYVTFNGVASQYVAHPLQAQVGQPFTVAFVNAGPNEFSAFHVVGTVIRDAQASGNPANHLKDVQTYTVAPGDGALFHLEFNQPGLYPFVSHSMSAFSEGAVGKFDVVK